MANNENRGIRRIIKACWYSIAGFKAAWKNEEAFRQEIIIGVFVIPVGLWLGTTGTQKALLIGFYLIIPLMELLNSAIEAIVDRMGPEHHVLSGRAKDLGSATVLLSIWITIIVWGLIAYDRFFP
ncbi:diacylglycerol kinase [Deltaproteobacteria bacterium]|nr:diacylglycerol kinase [Deltaproteobacteria bacterium]